MNTYRAQHLLQWYVKPKKEKGILKHDTESI